VLAVIGGLALIVAVVVFLTQEDFAREMVRAMTPLLTLPVALCLLAALVAIAATAIAYGLGVESRGDASGQSYGLYRKSAVSRSNAVVAQAVTTQDSFSVDR